MFPLSLITSNRCHISTKSTKMLSHQFKTKICEYQDGLEHDSDGFEHDSESHQLNHHSRSRKKLEWEWCSVTLVLITILTLSVHIVDANCGLITSLGNLYPENVSVLVDSSFNLTCTLEADSYSASDIVFTHHNEPISADHVTILDDRTARLDLDNVNENQTGRYYCKVRNKDLVKLVMVCVSEVLIGYKPEDRPVNDFNCKYLYRKELRCQWTKPKNAIHTSYEVVRRLYGYAAETFEQKCNPTIVDQNSNLNQCLWTTQHSVHNSRYYFILKSQNQFNTTETFVTFFLPELVQLNSLEEVTFNRTSNNLSWPYPNFIERDIELFPLVRFRVTVHRTDQPVEEDQVFIYNQNTTSAQLKLRPFTRYTLSVSSKIDHPKNHFWSKSYSINVTTLESVPSRPPTFIKEAFEVSSNLPRVATIYWTPLSEEDRNSASVSYKIECFDLSQKQLKCTDTQLTVETNRTSHTFSNLTFSQYSFRIFSQNFVGASKDFSEFIVPANTSISKPPNEISVLVDQSTTSSSNQHESNYKIDWEDLDDSIDNFTVFWCAAIGDICTSPLQWHFTDRRTHTLRLPSANYKFGVSANQLRSTSGIIWTECVIKAHQAIFRLNHLSAITKSASSILLQWDLLCRAQQNYIKKLHVDYCPVNDCHGQRRSIDIDARSNEYLFSGLVANTTYQFNVSSPSVSITSFLNKTTDLDAPGTPFNQKAQLKKTQVSVEWSFSRYMTEHFTLSFHEHHFIVEPVTSCEGTGVLCRFEFDVDTQLAPYRNYSVQISACNQKICSVPAEASFLTSPSTPGKMSRPSVEKLVANRFRVHLKVPSRPNGPIDYFFVKKWLNSSSETLVEFSEEKLYPSQEFADIEVECRSSEMKNYMVAVSAVNIVNGKEMRGESSDPIKIDMCTSVPFHPLHLLGVFFLFVVGISLFCALKYYRSYKKKEDLFSPHVPANNPLDFEQYSGISKSAQEDELNRKESNTFTNDTTTSETSFHGHNSPASSFSTDSSRQSQHDDKLNNRQQFNPEYFHPEDEEESCRPLLNGGPLLNGHTRDFESNRINNSKKTHPTSDHLLEPLIKVPQTNGTTSHPAKTQTTTLPQSKPQPQSQPQPRPIIPNQNGYIRAEDLPRRLVHP